jgi:O-antigen/teichoic acid export membrane protein
MITDLKNLLKNSSVFTCANIIQKGIGFLMIPVYTHYLSPHDYGILELLELTISIISILSGMGLGAALIRFYYYYDHDIEKNEVISTAFIFMCAICILVVGGMEFLSKDISRVVFDKREYYQYLRIVFISMGLQTIAFIPESLLLARKQSLIYSLVSIGTLVSYLTLNILFVAVFEMGIEGIIASTLITKTLNILALLIITMRNIRLSFSWDKLKQMVRFGLPLVPGSLGMFVMHFSDRFFLLKYFNADDVGVYSLGYKFGMMISIIISQGIFSAWTAQGYEIAKKEDGKRTIARIFTYYVFTVILAGLCIAIFSKEVVNLMASPKYSGAASVIPIIALSYVMGGVATYFTLGIMISNKTKYMAYIQSSVAGINILLNMNLIRKYGIMGAALSTAVSFSLLSVVTLVVSQKLYTITIEYKRVFILFGLSLLMFLLSRAFVAPFLLMMGFKLVLISLFPMILYWGGFFEQEEIANGRKIVNVWLGKLHLSRKYSVEKI